MRRQHIWGPVAVCVAVLGLVLGSGTVHAQTPIELPWDPTNLLPDPAKFATELFNNALLGLSRDVTEKLASLVEALLVSSLINQTPPELSYGSDAVRGLWEKVRAAANAGLAVITVWGGVNVMLNPQIRAPYHGALELIPRLLVGALLVNTSLDWGRFVIDVNNALCREVGSASIPGWQALQQAGASSILVHLIAGGIYLVLSLLLAGQMLMRLALVDVLLILAPIALLCWVLPQTYSWARLWMTTFFGTVFVQFVQVVVLQLGTDLSTGLVSLVPAVAADPAGAAPGWLATLTLGMAVLQLARRVPRLMPGYPGGGDGWTPLRFFTVRQVSTLFGGERGRSRRGGG
jgi:TrbL/VirB6 plasmid conjugal transfer protein